MNRRLSNIAEEIIVLFPESAIGILPYFFIIETLFIYKLCLGNNNR